MTESGDRIPEILSRLAERKMSFQQAALALRAAITDDKIGFDREDQNLELEQLSKLLSPDQYAELLDILTIQFEATTLDVTIDPNHSLLGSSLEQSDSRDTTADVFRPISEARRFQRVKRITRPNGDEYWLAKDLNAQRDVLLQPADAENTKTLTSGRLVGGLEHPNIAPVYSIIAEGDSPAVIYRFNSGTPLSQWISESQATPRALRQALNIVISLCDALAFAHSKNIAHGSVNSDNIIVGDFHEVQLESWEHATADASVDDFLQDALGVLEIVAAVHRHFQSTPQVPKAELRILGRFNPENASEVSTVFDSVTALRSDLIAWLHRTPLHHVKEPFSYGCARFLRKHRKQVAAALAITLVIGVTFLYIASGVRNARLLLNQTNTRLEQQQTALAEQISKLDTAIEEATTQEKQAVLAAKLAQQQQIELTKESMADELAAEELREATLELMNQTSISISARQQADRATETEAVAAAAAKTARLELTRRQHESNEVQARDAITDSLRLLSQDDPTSALSRLVFAGELLRANPDTPHTTGLRNDLNSRIDGILRNSPLPGALIAIDGTSLAMRFDNNATFATSVLSRGDESFIKTIATDPPTTLVEFQIQPGAIRAAISSDLRFASVLHVNDSDFVLATYSVRDQALIHEVKLTAEIITMRVSNAADTAFSTSPQTLSVLTRERELFEDAIQHASRIADFNFSDDSSRIATASADKTARVWETTSALPLTDEINHPISVSSCTFADNNTLLTVTANGSGYQWNVSAYNSIGGYFTGPNASYKNRITATAWTSTHDELALCTSNNYLHVYRNDRQLRFQPRRFSHPLTSVQFSKDSRILLVTDWIGQVHLINSQSGESLCHPTPPYLQGTSIGIAHQNDRLFVHHGDVIQVWHPYLSVNSPSIKMLPFFPTSFAGSNFTTDSIAISNSGQLAHLSLDTDRVGTFMDITQGTLDVSPPLQVIRSGMKNILTDKQHRVFFFAVDAIPTRFITQHAGPVTAFSVSPNGRYLATASRDRTVHLVDLQTNTIAPRLDWFGAAVHQTNFLTDQLLYIESASKTNPDIVLRQLYNINTTKLVNLPPSQDVTETVTALSATRAAYAFVTAADSLPVSHVQLFHSQTGVLQNSHTFSGEVVGMQAANQDLYAVTKDGRLLHIELKTGNVYEVGKTNHTLTDLTHSPIDGLLVLYANSGAVGIYDLTTLHFVEIATSGSGTTQLLRNAEDQHPVLFRDNAVRLFQSMNRSDFLDVALEYLSSIGITESKSVARQISIDVLARQSSDATKAALRFDWIKHNAIHMPKELASAHFESLASGEIAVSTEQLLTAAANAGNWTKAIEILDGSLQMNFSFRQAFFKAAFLRLDDRHTEADLFLKEQLPRVTSASPADKLLFLNAAALSLTDKALHDAAYQIYADSSNAFRSNVTVLRTAALLTLRLSNTEAYESLTRQLQNTPNKNILAPLNALALSLGYLDSTSTRQSLSRLANRLPFTNTHNLQSLSPELLLFELIYQSLKEQEATP